MLKVIFSFKKNYLNTKLLVFSINLNVPIFIYFLNVLFCEFLKFFLVNRVCKYFEFMNFGNFLI